MGLSGLALFFVVVVGIALYFVPSIIAYQRKHTYFLPIFAINFLFGWSMIGWVAALVWAFVDNKPVASAAPEAATASTTASEPDKH